VDTCGDELRVDLVGEDAHGERLVDGLIEADEQLQQALSTATHEHGVGAVFVGSPAGCALLVVSPPGARSPRRSYLLSLSFSV
jgi:hypothetical protein